MINNRQNGRRRGRGGGGAQMRGPNTGNDRGNRIDNRARGNAAQLLEKYKNLARDAQTQGDRVMTEYYLQFADHYFRVLAETRSRFEDQNQNQGQQRRQRFESDFDDGEGDEADGIDDGAEGEFQPEPQRYRPERGEREDRGNGRDERRRDYREPAAVKPPEAPAFEQSAPVAAAEEETPKPRRGRPRRKPEAEPQRLDVDRLPPSFAAQGEEADAPAKAPEEEEGEAPPRRRRTRRATSAEDNVAA